jgi:phosphatidylserine decarboxylase
MACPIPVFLRAWAYTRFAHFFGINLTEVEKALSEYSSLDDFFTRALKPEARPMGVHEKQVLSPVDAVLLASGPLQKGTLIQAKGISYALHDLMGDSSSLFQSGYFMTFYLSPRDCHRIFSPVAGKVIRSTVIPGRLFPVREPYISGFSGLYTRNARVVTILETESGRVAVVMVGAFNVGKMDVTYDPSVHSAYFSRTIRHRDYSGGDAFSPGDWLGTFHLGSTVVLVMENEGFSPRGELTWGTPVRYGQPIGWMA